MFLGGLRSHLIDVTSKKRLLKALENSGLFGHNRFSLQVGVLLLYKELVSKLFKLFWE